MIRELSDQSEYQCFLYLTYREIITGLHIFADWCVLCPLGADRAFWRRSTQHLIHKPRWKLNFSVTSTRISKRSPVDNSHVAFTDRGEGDRHRRLAPSAATPAINHLRKLILFLLTSREQIHYFITCQTSSSSMVNH